MSERLDEYLAALAARRVSANTLRAYRQDLQAAEHGVRMDLASVTAADLAQYILSLQGRGAATVRRHIASLRAFFTYGVAAGWLANYPALALVRPQMKRRLPVYLGDSEVARLLRQPKTADALAIRDGAILKFLYYTGVRSAELLALDLADLRDGEVVVQGKGGKQRLVPIHKELLEVLQGWLAVRGRNAGPLFTTLTRDRGRISYSALYLIVQGRLAELGLDVQAGSVYRLSAHKLRHTFATQLLRKGVTIPEISSLLGHADWATTQIYAHADRLNLRAAVDRL